MKSQLERLELITNIHDLTAIKEKLKDDVMNPMLNWHERMELYESIQCINTRIRYLTLSLEKRPLT